MKGKYALYTLYTCLVCLCAFVWLVCVFVFFSLSIKRARKPPWRLLYFDWHLNLHFWWFSFIQIIVWKTTNWFIIYFILLRRSIQFWVGNCAQSERWLINQRNQIYQPNRMIRTRVMLLVNRCSTAAVRTLKFYLFAPLL